MSIRLSYYLDKNRIDLKKMCEQFKILSYKHLIDHCNSRGIKCDFTEKEYDSLFPKEKVVKNETKRESEAVKPKTRRRSRKPKAKKGGDADSKSST